MGGTVCVDFGENEALFICPPQAEDFWVGTEAEQEVLRDVKGEKTEASLEAVCEALQGLDESWAGIFRLQILMSEFFIVLLGGTSIFLICRM